MEYHQLEMLEDRINMIIELVARLKTENKALKQQNLELLAKAQEDERTIQRLQKEYQELISIQEETATYREREEQIKTKVEAMLSKLNSLQLSI